MRTALILGSGNWAKRVTDRLLNLDFDEVCQLSARTFLEERINKNLGNYSLIACITRPAIQEALVPSLATMNTKIWLEKPLASSPRMARELLNIFENSSAIALVNFSWLFSSVWQSFKKLEITQRDFQKIIILRNGNLKSRSYISLQEDYGSHDLALVFDWLNIKNAEIDRFNSRFSEFTWVVGNQRFIWKWDPSYSSSPMVWEIHLKNGEIMQIDFYNKRITYDGVLIVKSSAKKDNIEVFVETLLTVNQINSQRNLALGVEVKNFFHRLREK